MKKIFTFIFLLVMSSSFGIADAKSLEFAIVSDIHLRPSEEGKPFTDTEKNLIFAVDSINRNDDIDYVLFLGDCIDKSNLESLDSFMNIVKNVKKPYYMVFGNHDSYAAGGVEKEEFAKYIHSYNKRQDKKETSFYFKAAPGAYGLVADGSSYVVPGKHGRYVPELLSEIERLLKHKQSSMIFIFQHFPLISPNDNTSHDTLDTDNYKKLIKKYGNVVFIASGHFHYKNLIIDENGVYHISAPALGARASSSGSGMYQIIKVNYDKRFLCRPKNIKTEVKDVIL